MVRQTIKIALSSVLIAIVSSLAMEMTSPKKGYAYDPARLLHCSFQFSSQYGNYYLGVYRTRRGFTFEVVSRSYCQYMVDADDYYFR